MSDIEALKAGGRTLTGTPQMLIEHIHTYEQAGAGEVMLQWLDLNDIDGLRAFAASVLPHLQRRIDEELLRRMLRRSAS